MDPRAISAHLSAVVLRRASHSVAVAMALAQVSSDRERHLIPVVADAERALSQRPVEPVLHDDRPFVIFCVRVVKSVIPIRPPLYPDGLVTCEGQLECDVSPQGANPYD